jgi:BioD-like phosphotransacetylase family protein
LGVLYIVSAEEASGKTAICAGLAINFMNEGKKVGYLKPQAAEGRSDGDIAFMKKVLGTGDVVNAPDLVKGRDVVLVEGGLGKKAADDASQATYEAVKEMQAKVIAMETYTGRPRNISMYIKGSGKAF